MRGDLREPVSDPAQLVQANAVTVACGQPQVGGAIGLSLDVSVLGKDKHVSAISAPVPNSATLKCEALAGVLQTQLSADPLLSGIVVSTSGANLTIDAGADFIEKAVFAIDTSKEFTTLSSNLATGQLARIEEVVVNPTGIPPAGFYFGLFEYTPILGTFGATANGVDDGETVLNALNNNFTSHFGIAFGAPTTDGSLPVLYSDWFDPTTVAIGWDGNTEQYLANFGLEFQPPAQVPEPATLALLGIGLAGLGFSRSGRRHLSIRS